METVKQHNRVKMPILGYCVYQVTPADNDPERLLSGIYIVNGKKTLIQ